MRLRVNGLLDRLLRGRLGVRSGSHGSACGSRRARRLATWLAHVSLRRMVRGGPGVLPDGSLAALRRSIRFETGPAPCPTARTWRFSGWLEAGTASCPTARSRRFGGCFGRNGPSVLPAGSRNNCFTGKIRKGIRSHTRPSWVRAGAQNYSSWLV